MTTSARAASRWATAAPSGSFRSIAIDRLLRFTWRKYADSSPANGGPHRRVPSPSGRSTLTTSAPRSPSIMVQYGPARIWVRSSTRMPARGRSGCGTRPMIGAAALAGRRAVGQLGELGERPLAVAVGLHVVLHGRQVAVRVDHEPRPDDAEVRLAVVLLLAPGSVGLGDRVVGVDEERERQLVVRPEPGVGFGRVGADAQNRRSGLLELAPVVADVARLRRTARGLVLGIEVDDDRAVRGGRSGGSSRRYRTRERSRVRAVRARSWARLV